VLLLFLVAGALAVVHSLRGSGVKAQTRHSAQVGRPSPNPQTPGMKARTEDYAQARAQFHTRLVRKIRAPQRWQVEVPPPDAREMNYTSGGLKLRAWVSSPPPAGTPKKAAVLFLHGGFAFGADDWEQAQPYRDAGYVVMIPMLRGENGQPGAYSMFYNEVDDVLAAADVLAGLPYVDSGRLYVAGHSVGGTLAMLTSMTSTKFRAAASLSGSPDQEVWSAGQPQVIVFDPSDVTEFEMRSPLAFPGSFKCPARLYYGSQEVLFRDNTEELARRAKAAGRDVAAVQVPGGHLSMVDGAMRQSIRFFQQH
jgi:dipeptidyl aminopeptidase/acylaminoacyl peptidase